MSKTTKTFLALFLLILIAGGVYYWFFLRVPTGNVTVTPGVRNAPAFNPLNNTPVTQQPSNTTTNTANPDQNQSTTPDQTAALPVLRQLSIEPIGGFMASTTASSTLSRYIDRGTGHIYQTSGDSLGIDKISNTTLPRIYESFWNRNLTAMILRYIKDGNDTIVNFYAEIRPTQTAQATSSSDTTTPFELKGKFLSPNIKEVAVSPKGDRVFTLNTESGQGVGYISGFDESKKTQILQTPLTQLNVDWPEENTIVLTTKPSATSSGYLYFLDAKKGTMTKVISGKIVGLAGKASSDAKKVIFSSGGSTISTALYNIKDGSTQQILFKTLADKCVWGKVNPQDVYCAVPVEIPTGMYPDDWYKGTVSFVDQIWHLDATTGEIHLIANLLDLSGKLIDATNLTLHPKEKFLYFMNKRDLTLWSLDLNN